MNEADRERMIDGIDRHLAYLHKERWARDHATLRAAARAATGEDRERAEQAVLDHYRTRDRPQSSRDHLIGQATAKNSSAADA